MTSNETTPPPKGFITKWNKIYFLIRMTKVPTNNWRYHANSHFHSLSLSLSLSQFLSFFLAVFFVIVSISVSFPLSLSLSKSLSLYLSLSLSLCLSLILSVYIYIYYHYHIVPLAWTSLTLPPYASLLSITSGRSSRLHPVSVQSCCRKVLAGRPTLARPCEGIHWRTSLMRC